MPSSLAHTIATLTASSFLEAPAGFGKTTLISEAVSITERRVLILTHTHAGVHSLRAKLSELGVAKGKYRLETIDAWCLRLVSGYPATSGCAETGETGQVDWPKVREGMARLLANENILRIVGASADMAIVDEYQDCSGVQHSIVMALAAQMPVCLLGDPLQAIFEFDGPPVSWDTDIRPHFAELPQLEVPHRWNRGSKDLGQWVKEAREPLKDSRAPSYPPALVRVFPYKMGGGINDVIIEAMKARRYPSTDTVVVLEKFPPDAHYMVKRIAWAGYSSMDEIEGKDLLAACRRLEGLSGHLMVAELIRFADMCFTKGERDLKTVLAKVDSNDIGTLERLEPKAITPTLKSLCQSGTLADAVNCLQLLADLPKRRQCREELFWSMKKAINVSVRQAIDLPSAARQVRDAVAHSGRKPRRRIVSRTLLVKGLEYDHVILVRPERLTPRELYVAISRGTKSLTIVSDNPTHISLPKA